MWNHLKTYYYFVCVFLYEVSTLFKSRDVHRDLFINMSPLAGQSCHLVINAHTHTQTHRYTHKHSHDLCLNPLFVACTPFCILLLNMVKRVFSKHQAETFCYPCLRVLRCVILSKQKSHRRVPALRRSINALLPSGLSIIINVSLGNELKKDDPPDCLQTSWLLAAYQRPRTVCLGQIERQ